MTFLEGIFPIHLGIRIIADFLKFCKTASTSQTVQIHIYSLAQLTAEEILFHGENNFYCLIQSLPITTHHDSSTTRSVHTSVREAKKTKKKVSGSCPQTGFYTNHRDHLCISQFLPAQLQACRGPPDTVSPQRALKGCLQVCFPACCLSHVSLTLSSAYISTGVI